METLNHFINDIHNVVKFYIGKISSYVEEIVENIDLSSAQIQSITEFWISVYGFIFWALILPNPLSFEKNPQNESFRESFPLSFICWPNSEFSTKN